MILALALLAASGARQASGSRVASAARHGWWPPHVDPSTFLTWSVPLLMFVPLVTFVLVAVGARTRRWTTNLTILGLLASVVCTGVTLWARWGHSDSLAGPSVSWLSFSPTFSGPTQYQNFALPFSMRVDHPGLVGILAAQLIALAATVWGRMGAREDPGPARNLALVSLFVFMATGVMLFDDLGGILVFWLVAGGVSYLLASQRWTREMSARSSRAVLAVPFLADLALLAGVALLYSRYGQLSLSGLPAVLHTTWGWGYKSLTTACLLIGVGIGGRAGLVPLNRWQAPTTGAVPVALLQGVWPVMAGVVLFRAQPIIAMGGPQTLPALTVWALAAAVLAAIIALAGNDVFRVVAAVGSGATALDVVVLLYGRPATAVAVLVAVGVARSGLVLVAANLSVAMRTTDIAHMGSAFNRMPTTAVAAVLASLGLALATASGGWGGFRAGRVTVPYWIALLLVGVVAARPVASAILRRLRPRRAFEPRRVVEVAGLMRGPALALGALGVAAAIAGMLPIWIRFLDGKSVHGPSVNAVLFWLATSVLAWAAGLVLYGPAGRLPLHFSGLVGTMTGRGWRRLLHQADRLAGGLAPGALHGLESGAAWLGARIGLAVSSTAEVVEMPGPGVVVGLGLLLLAALVIALLTPGVLLR